MYLSPRVAIEGTAAFSRPVLAIHLSGDFEGAADTIASETLTEYVIGGSLLYHFGSGRVVPFVLGGAAYLRQLHDDAAVLQTGTELHAGGGIKCWFGSGRRRSGLRVDAQVSARDRSAGFADKRIALPVVTAGMAFQF